MTFPLTARLDDEPPSVEELFEAYGPAVARWAQRLGGPDVDAEDVLQEVFLVVQRRRPKEQGPAKLSTWLYQTTLNIVHQHRRRARLRRWLGRVMSQQGNSVHELSPIEDLEAREKRALANRVLEQMSERARTVFILFEVEHLTGAEIAELLDAKVETVWVWLHRARTEFFKRMREHHEEVA